MPERPILRLPNPNTAEVPGGPRFVPNLRKPTKGRQRNRFAPVFDRLQTVLSRPGEPIELQNDPTALAPERVIVFEIGGTVQNFLKALTKVDGLEFMAELETEFVPSEDFAVTKEGQDVAGKDVPGRLYLAPYVFPVLDNAPKLSPVEALKLVRCFKYQSSEAEDWEGSEAAAFCSSLQSIFINDLPGYDEAPWALDSWPARPSADDAIAVIRQKLARGISVVAL